jgi:hypothetical protein
MESTASSTSNRTIWKRDIESQRAIFPSFLNSNLLSIIRGIIQEDNKRKYGSCLEYRLAYREQKIWKKLPASRELIVEF